ncbi:MAG: anaerobic ribonucleoside-triphosphate reductase, partial [Capnocytophaga felis]|nr:anaerobic ribonucleoside-triphosphate reductase [Capnocytophaga felis]
QFAGAVATVEFLMYFDYFARKDYGIDYLKTHEKIIENEMQHVVYAINQPAAARGYQSVFWNISLYDKPYFDSMFGNFVFPDGSKPIYESLDSIQKYFMKWFNNERTKAILTFPVVTAAMLTKNKKVHDQQFADFCAEELSEGNAFFIYQSDNADSLASCCRLRNEISDNTFSYSLGAGGVSTGSINVITINMNRLYQKGLSLERMIDNIHKYQVAYRAIIQDYKDARMLPVYDAGFISLNKQFLTIGINGMVEAAEYLGIKISDNEEYKAFINKNLKLIYNKNKEAKAKYGYMFNTEFVPAENLGVKNANWDRADGLFVPRDCYNSYFYVVEDESVNIIDRFYMHGHEYIQFLDGGSAYHCNLEEYPTKEGFLKLLNVAAKTGCNYFCFNIKVTCCNSCGYINKHTSGHCVKCHSTDVDYATRIIGYLKRITNFSKDRQKEAKKRYYGNATV